MRFGACVRLIDWMAVGSCYGVDCSLALFFLVRRRQAGTWLGLDIDFGLSVGCLCLCLNPHGRYRLLALV